MRGDLMLDLDGVVYPFAATFKAWAEGYEGRELQAITDWHFYREWGWDDAFFVARLSEYGADGGFGDAEPDDGTYQLLDTCAYLGIDVHILTDRPETAIADTNWWVETHLQGYASLTITREKTDIFKWVDGPVFSIEDRVENVAKMAAAGADSVVMDRPWNQAAEGFRVYDLYEYSEYLRQIAENA